MSCGLRDTLQRDRERECFWLENHYIPVVLAQKRTDLPSLGSISTDIVMPTTQPLSEFQVSAPPYHDNGVAFGEFMHGMKYTIRHSLYTYTRKCNLSAKWQIMKGAYIESLSSAIQGFYIHWQIGCNHIDRSQKDQDFSACCHGCDHAYSLHETTDAWQQRGSNDALGEVRVYP